MGPFVEGFRAARNFKPGETLTCPYNLRSREGIAWLAGADFGAERDEH